MIWMDVVKLALSFIPLVTSLMMYYHGFDRLGAGGLREQRRGAVLLIALSVLALLLGPVAALVLDYSGALLVLNLVFGAVWVAIQGIQITNLRRARSALAGVS